MITKGPLHWPHQMEALREIHSRRGTLLWVPMRAGKTRIAIDYIQNVDVFPVLILCPVKVAPVWEYQIGEYAVTPPDVLMLNKGTVKDRAARLKEARTSGQPFVAIMNYGAVHLEPLKTEMLKVKWGAAFLDECHRLNAPGGQTSRHLGRVCRTCKKVVGLTGTPGGPLGSPKDPAMRESGIIDIYGSMRAIAPSHFAKNYKDYCAAFGVWNAFTPFPKIEGYQNQDVFNDKLRQVCYMVQESDFAYTMPEAIIQQRPVFLPPAAMGVYKTLEQELTAEWLGENVSVANALVKQLRLQQMAGGYLQLDGMEAVAVIHTEKFDGIEEIVEDLPEAERVIIFCQFKPEMAELTRRFLLKKKPVFHMKGGVDTSDEWKRTPGAVLIAQIAAGAEGVDLSISNYCIYCSLCPSLIKWQQSFKRPQMPNKKHPIAYYMITAQGTVDEDIYASLLANEEVVDSVRQRQRERIKNNGARN